MVTETSRQADRIEQNNKLYRRLAKTIHRTPVSLIAEDIQFINRRLRKSQYFYIDIKREGILLYDSGKFQLAEPIEISPKERNILAEKDFDHWFKNADDFIKYHKLAFGEGDLNKAAFFLHQATECFLWNDLVGIYSIQTEHSRLRKIVSEGVKHRATIFIYIPTLFRERKRTFQVTS